MKFKAKNLQVKQLLDGKLEVTLLLEYKSRDILDELEKLLNLELDCDIKKWSNPRSLKHNALFWSICNELSKHINDPLITANEIYRQLILEYGYSVVFPVNDEVLEFVIKSWEQRGLGWYTQVLRKSKFDGNFTNIQFWYGSSVYTSKMMWRLVEGLKALCKENRLDISHYDKQLEASIKELERLENEEKIKNASNKNLALLSGKRTNIK